MKVNCLSCGHSLDLRDAYDDYEGQVRCFICAGLLTIRTARRPGEIGRVGTRARAEAVACTPAAHRVVFAFQSNGFEQEEAT